MIYKWIYKKWAMKQLTLKILETNYYLKHVSITIYSKYEENVK